MLFRSKGKIGIAKTFTEIQVNEVDGNAYSIARQLLDHGVCTLFIQLTT